MSFCTRTTLFLALLLPVAGVAHARPGDLDKKFAQDGRSIESIVDKATDQGEMIALGAGGRFVVAGVAGLPEEAHIGVAAYTADGHPDNKFGEAGRVVTDLGGRTGVYGLVVDLKGRIVVAGYSKQADRRVLMLVRYLRDGKLDSSFGKGGKVLTDVGSDAEIHYLALQPDGHLVAAGFITHKKDSDILVARYSSDGSLDSTFGNGGWKAYDFTADDRGYGLALGKKGEIFVAGSVSHTRTGSDGAVLKILPNGDPDKDFGYGGLAIVRLSTKEDVLSSVIVLRDGSIVAGGYSEEKKTEADFALIKLAPDGTLDSTFGNQGWVTADFQGGNDVVHALAEDAAGHLIVAGEYQNMARHYYRELTGFGLMRFTGSGHLDTTFGVDGKVADDFGKEDPALANAMVLQGKGILTAGFATKNFAVFRFLN